jgi:hypothetical protein
VERVLGRRPAVADGRFHGGQVPADRGRRLGRDALGREARDLDLDDAPALEVVAERLGRGRTLEDDRHHVRVEQVPRLAWRHDRAAAVLDRDQPALLERPDAFARRAAAHAVLLRELDLLVELRARWQHARYDVGADRVQHRAVQPHARDRIMG